MRWYTGEDPVMVYATGSAFLPGVGDIPDVDTLEVLHIFFFIACDSLVNALSYGSVLDLVQVSFWTTWQRRHLSYLHLWLRFFSLRFHPLPLVPLSECVKLFTTPV